MSEPGRLIVASARLPVTVSKKGERWVALASSGGLVTALKPVAEERGFEWIGWSGAAVPEPERAAVNRLLAEHGCRPVHLGKQEVDGFYGGLSNGVLWPLFHGMPDLSKYSRADWRTYARVNEMFADEIARVARPSDVVWVHDYQLSLLPELLRRRGVSCPIGFFLHIPFPSSEVYRTLPVREHILGGMLGADFVGFHAYEYVSHFRKACLRVLGMESDPGSIRAGSRRVHLGVLPIGIDPDEVAVMAQGQEAKTEYKNLKETYRGKKIILGVDRLDYTKGIPEKLLAFEELLRTQPKWREECVLLQVAAPSRESVDEYQALKRRVDELVGRINGRFSTPRHTPIVYINQSIPRTRLVGMYEAADVALVTPLRDGMNLVALEYIAARAKLGARLILSEFAGAAYLLPGARLVNPYNTADVAQALIEELEGGGRDDEHMLEFVKENTSQKWAKRFLDRLEGTQENTTPAARFSIDNPRVRELLVKAKRPLVLLDYDGTLRRYERKPDDAKPTTRIKNALQLVCKHADVYVVSGRPAQTLEKWLVSLPIGLVCEHGFATRDPGGKWKEIRTSHVGILKRVDVLFAEFTRRTPGASVERKRSSIAWHYRGADPEFGAFQANELLGELEDMLRRRPYGVLRGNRVVEVRHINCSKGTAVEDLLRRHTEADAVLCAGDDRTDEDMMEAIRRLAPDTSVCCWVSGRSVSATYWIESPDAFVAELEQLGRLWQTRKSPVGAALPKIAESTPVPSRKTAQRTPPAGGTRESLVARVPKAAQAVRAVAAKKATPKRTTGAPAKKGKRTRASRR